MRPKIVVFLGPSLPKEEAELILEAVYRPPARRGDILKAATDGADIIGLIDGVFFQKSAVAHREILHALRMGAMVFGSSSMGALRASELDGLGMEGVGKIYELYKSGELVSDDEVALSFDPITLRPLSEPLINIRYNLRMALREGVIDRDASRLILNSAISIYFPNRTYENVLDSAEGLDKDTLERFAAFLRSDGRDLKREDAIIALKRIKEVAERL